MDDIVDKNMHLDILCYSKTLAKSIISDEKIGNKLVARFGEINDCTSENIDNQRPENTPQENRFDNAKCNIGTNFKSGVSIEKDNHAFIIILPPRSSQSFFKNNYGIFSGGINSIVQAIARKRRKGEIHIILPRPNRFNYESLKSNFSENQIGVFRNWYQKIEYYKEDYMMSELVHYQSLNEQSETLNLFYEEKLKKYVQKGIDSAMCIDRGNLARLDYPKFKNFVLNRGEAYLSDSVKFWGGDLSAYITYCAISNQFVNCQLDKINYKNLLIFKEGEIQKKLGVIFKRYFDDDYMEFYYSYSNFNKFYSFVRNRIFKEFSIKLRSSTRNKSITIKPYSSVKFEKELLRFIIYQYYGNTYHCKSLVDNMSSDLGVTRSQYLLDSISCALGLDSDNELYSTTQKERINAFQELNYFREYIRGKLSNYTINGTTIQYLPKKPEEGFYASRDLIRMRKLILFLKNKDEFIKNGVFEFIRNYDIMTDEQKINSFHRILIEDFFILLNDKKITINNTRCVVNTIANFKQLGSKEKCMNFITPPELKNQDIYFRDYTEFAIKEFGTLENAAIELLDITEKL